MIGIDEVGRGSWAGPLLVVAARQVSGLPAGLKDSKVLSKKKRNILCPDIQLACDLGEGWVTPNEIDNLGLTGAMELGVKRALDSLNATDDENIVIDGHINYCATNYHNVICVIAADAKYPIVSAASVWAKVVRDEYMVELAKSYPDYGFDSHVGYGTKRHMDALSVHGVTPVHRLSYAPVKKIANEH